jgi:molecular chaperone DnaK
LTPEEIERMVQDAEVHAEEDRARRDLIAARNHADSLLYTADRSLREAGDAVPATVRTAVEDQMRAVRQALDSENIDEIRNRSAELAVALQQVNQVQQQAAGADATPRTDDDGVVDGEYKVE